MRIDVVTIFPAYFDALELSLLGKARRSGALEVVVHDLRDHTYDRHRTVDDTPYGGGPGMVMRPEPWGAALDAVRAEHAASPDPLLVVPTPAGQLFTQRMAQQWVTEPGLVIACGRYEGIDARVVEVAAGTYRVVEVSLGDYVLNGGEVAALAMVEAVGRLIPGVVGNAESLTDESHADGLLEAPAYTKPDQWRGHEVPEVLLSGHHQEIARWRREQSVRRTARVRPDLIEALDPRATSPGDREVLATCGWIVERGRFRRVDGPVAD